MKAKGTVILVQVPDGFCIKIQLPWKGVRQVTLWWGTESHPCREQISQVATNSDGFVECHLDEPVTEISIRERYTIKSVTAKANAWQGSWIQTEILPAYKTAAETPSCTDATAVTPKPRNPLVDRLGRRLRSAFDYALSQLDSYRSKREDAKARIARETRKSPDELDAEARRLRADALFREAETHANVAETEAWVASRRVEAEEERRTITADAEAQAELHRRETEDACLEAREKVVNKKETWDHRLQWVKKSVAWVKEEIDDYYRRKATRIALAKSHGGKANLNPFAAFLSIMTGIALLVLSLVWARAAVINPTGPWGTLYFACFAGSLLSLFASWRLRKQPLGKALKQTFINPVTIPAALVGLGLMLRAWQ